MATNPPKSAREKKRLGRKRELAKQQAQQFEDELSGHELNLARLEAVPTAARDEAWSTAKAEAQASMDVINAAITTTLAEASKISDADVA